MTAKTQLILSITAATVGILASHPVTYYTGIHILLYVLFVNFPLGAWVGMSIDNCVKEKRDKQLWKEEDLQEAVVRMYNLMFYSTLTEPDSHLATIAAEDDAWLSRIIGDDHKFIINRALDMDCDKRRMEIVSREC